MPSKGARDGAIVDGLLGFADAGFGSRDLALGELDFGLQAVGLHGGVVERLLRLNAGFFQFARAVQFDLRILELYFIVRNRGLRGVAVGFGGIESALGVGIVERGEKLALWTCVPSSKKTPVTRPVILAAMVARRRGVT